MSVLVWLLILMMMKMKSDAAPAKIITARSGEAVLLIADLQGPGLEQRKDVRWTHLHLVVSLKNNVTTCHHGRCELLNDGSLSFSRVQTADSGNYSLEVFDEEGKRLGRKDFLLRVEADSSSAVLVSVLVCCFLLLLFSIIVFIFRRRRTQRMRTAGPLQENVYVVMHSHHGNKKKNEEEEKLEGEESNYVRCNPAVSKETPITQQLSVGVEDIYV